MLLDGEEIEKAIINAEYEIADETTQSKKKKKKNAEEKIEYNEYDGLHARLRLRRGLLTLYLSLHQKFSPSKRDQISSNIVFCQKSLEIIKETFHHSADCANYFNADLPKTLLCHLPPRKLIKVQPQETIERISTMLTHLNQVLELTKITSLYPIIRKIDDFTKQKCNLLPRAYLDVNIFITNGKYFNYYDMSDIIQVAFLDFSVCCKGFFI